MNFLKGLFFGSVVGASLGLLAAPSSGQATRSKLKKEVASWQEATDNVKISAQRVNTSLEQLKITAETTLPVFMEGMARTQRALDFQMTPRLAQIQTQIQKIQQELPKEQQK